MLVLLTAATLLVAAPPAASQPSAEAILGTVRVVGTEPLVTVTIRGDARELTLRGDMVEELRNLASLKVEALGHLDGGQLVVKEYRIIDVGGGVKPLVGTLVKAGDKLALRDGDADPILLSINQRGFQRLSQVVGGKVWIAGDKLVSGEVKVSRYGIVRRPKALSDTQDGGGEVGPAKSK